MNSIPCALVTAATTPSFSLPPIPPRPTILLLGSTDLCSPPSTYLLVHTKLPLRSIKRDHTPSVALRRRSPTPVPRYNPVPRATSSPLSSCSSPYPDTIPTTTPEPIPAVSTSTLATAPDEGLILRPKGAQLSLKSCSQVENGTLIKQRIKALALTELDESRSYSRQKPEVRAAFRAKIIEEFPALRKYEDQWPLQAYISAHLKYTVGHQKDQAVKSAVAALSRS